jgi:hypothetical protein
MQVFREMYVRGKSADIAELMNAVEKSLPDSWRRDRTSEDDIQTYMHGAKSLYCFVHDRDDDLPSATIYLAEKSDGVLVASNIHPHKKRQLTHDEYNSILEAFYNQVVKRCAEKMEVPVELTSNQADPSDWLLDETAAKLRAFSASGNKGAGFLLTEDHERWFDFIVTAHAEKSQLDASALRRWLIEIEGWAPEIADQLAGEYAFGGELLTFTGSRRGGN